MPIVQNATLAAVPVVQQRWWGMAFEPCAKRSRQLLVRSTATAESIAAAKLAFETRLSDIGIVHKPDADMGIFGKLNEDIVASLVKWWLHGSADCTGERCTMCLEERHLDAWRSASAHDIARSHGSTFKSEWPGRTPITRKDHATERGLGCVVCCAYLTGKLKTGGKKLVGTTRPTFQARMSAGLRGAEVHRSSKQHSAALSFNFPHYSCPFPMDTTPEAVQVMGNILQPARFGKPVAHAPRSQVKSAQACLDTAGSTLFASM